MSDMQRAMQTLAARYPWTRTPLVVGAPMKVFSSPALAVAVSAAGGLGFIGPGNKPDDLETELASARDLVRTSVSLARATADQASSSPALLPVGIGIQTWCGDLSITRRILSSARDQSGTASLPCAVWLFAPRHGQRELDEWTLAIRAISPAIQIWLQLASVRDCLGAVQECAPGAQPDVIVVQGADAGGHSLTQGAGLMTLLPEVADALHECGAAGADEIPLVAAGGIADARGAGAAFVLGAAGVALGTRLLLTPEAKVNPGYQRAILAARDGGQTTVKTQLYNQLRGTMDWPAEFDPRGLINATWRDHMAGVPFEKLKELHSLAMEKGEAAWGAEEGRTATYAGTNVGLIRDMRPAGEIVQEVRDGIAAQLDQVTGLLQVQ